jgi:uncharacterized protein (TIGR02453 family)
MAYFTKDFINFYKELEQNNHKEWFDENRKRYEKVVKTPFRKFLADLILEVQKFDPEIMIEPKNAVFRINRDIRFSKDKRPYKTNAAAVISRINKKEEFPAYYVNIDLSGLMVGGGMYSLSTDTLNKVRQEILYSDKEFEEIITGDFKKEFGEIKGEQNKILKPPYKEASEKLPILFNKQFYFMKNLPLETIYKDNLPEILAEKMQAALALNQFLRRAID